MGTKKLRMPKRAISAGALPATLPRASAPLLIQAGSAAPLSYAQVYDLALERCSNLGTPPTVSIDDAVSASERSAACIAACYAET